MSEFSFFILMIFFPFLPLFFDVYLFFNNMQADEGDYHGRSREISRNQWGGKAPGESQIISVLKAFIN